MKLGYVRVSAKDQNPERHLRNFVNLELKNVISSLINKVEKNSIVRVSGDAPNHSRRGFDLDALDRLGRDYDGIILEWKYITRKLNADIVVLENETLFDSRKFRGMGDLGKLMEDQFLSLLSYVAEQERKKNRQRQAEGIEVAKNKGVKFGRRKYEINADFIRVYDEWKSGLITATEGMKRLDLNPNTFYRRVKKYENQRKGQIPCEEKNFLQQTND
ncbi:recombinase family protein [Bacillus sp. CFBP9009]